jgi:hypothetical protein
MMERKHREQASLLYEFRLDDMIPNGHLAKAKIGLDDRLQRNEIDLAKDEDGCGVRPTGAVMARRKQCPEPTPKRPNSLARPSDRQRKPVI